MPKRSLSTPLSRLARPQTLLSQTEQVLRQAIARGEFAGNKLPSAQELAQQLGVSRETVRLAQEALQREGLLVKYRRKGTLIEPPPMTLEKRRARSTLLGYLEADYSSPRGREEGVTLATGALMLRGAMREAGRAGYQLVVHHSRDTEMERVLDRISREAPLQGVIFASFGEEKLVRRALGLGWPTVLLDHDLNLPRISTVREDSLQGAELAVRHLAELGHRRIAYADWRRGDLNPWRIMGYRKGLQEARLPRRRVWELSAEITPEGAKELVPRLLALDPRPTALVCFNNTLAALVMDRLSRQRVRVPEDLSVMGIGGEEIPGLSCNQADWFAMGRMAVEVLLRLIDDPEGGKPENHLFPYALRPGKTTAAPPPE